jgi:hypothetical protein
LRLKDQPIREEEVVKSLELGGEMPLTAHIPGEFDIEKVRGETLNAERCPIAGRMGVDVAAQPALEVEIGRDRTVVEPASPKMRLAVTKISRPSASAKGRSASSAMTVTTRWNWPLSAPPSTMR